MDSMDLEETVSASASMNRPALSLNSSFDAALLKRSDSEDTGGSACLRYAASWDEQQQQPSSSSIHNSDMLPASLSARKVVARPRVTTNKTAKRTPNSVKRPRTLRLQRSPHQHCALIEEPLPINKRAPKSSLGTHTTAASSTLLDETIDSNSACDSAGTPFRFSTFPASLPRLSQPPRDPQQEQQQQQPPATVRKRMSFGGIAFLEQQQQQQQQQQLTDDFDYTINTSLSSNGYDSDHSNSNNHLFEAEEEEDSNCSSLLGTPVLRTRLNFNALLSPNGGMLAPNNNPNHGNTIRSPAGYLEQGASQGHTQQHVQPKQSFPVLLDQAFPQRYKDLPSMALEDIITGDTFPNSHYKSSSVKNRKHTDNNDQDKPLSTKSTLCASPPRASMEAPVRLESHRPRTPREVQLHFQLDHAQCSPIPGIPEEDGDLSTSSSAGAAAFGSHTRNHSRLSHDSSSASSSGKMSARPMPDMHAFEGNGEVNSSHDQSIAEDSTVSSGATSRNQPPPQQQQQQRPLALQQQQQSPKLLCPPTPVRTPAWAHSHIAVRPIFKAGGGNLAKFGRTNSLVTTKVLATCPPQVLGGRASLENSSLEGDKSKDSIFSHELPPPIKRANTEDSDVETIDGDKDCHGMECDDHPLWPPVAHADDNNKDPGEFERPIGQSSMDPTTTFATSTTTDTAAATAPSTAQEGDADTAPVVSMATHFEVLSMLGSGAFADVFRVRSRVDGALYAVKRNRRPFRGRRDREKAMAEVKCMQRLQTSCVGQNEANVSYSLYILFFFQAWQEDCHFFVQTELCCRDTLSDVMDSLRSQWPLAESRYPSLRQMPPLSQDADTSAVDVGRLFPDETIWKVCHDVGAGLSHIHSHGFVHFDIKPSNVFFVSHPRLGAMCKIGDFGMAGEIGSCEDGQEGDQKYMASEILVSDKKHPSADIFSLGLMLYELSAHPTYELPGEGLRWHDVRSGKLNMDDIPKCRSEQLMTLILSMISPNTEDRPSADAILSTDRVSAAGGSCDTFLRSYIIDIEEFDRREEERFGGSRQDDKTPRTTQKPRTRICSPTLNTYLTHSKVMNSPEAAAHS